MDFGFMGYSESHIVQKYIHDTPSPATYRWYKFNVRFYSTNMDTEEASGTV